MFADPFSLVSPPKVKDAANKPQLLPHPSTILTSIFHSIPLDTVSESHLCSLITFPQHCSLLTVVYSLPVWSANWVSAPSGQIPSPRHRLYSQRSKDPLSESPRLSNSLFPLLWASLISKDQNRIYWDHLSSSGKAWEVLIDHLAVCTPCHNELGS